MIISHRPSRSRRGGFTMVEILLALALTGMIGAATSSMIFSVSYGTTTQADLRRITVKEKVVALRMNDAIGSSKMVLDQGTDYLVLWMGDQRQNGMPDLSEIRRIDRNSTTLALTSYRAPANLPEANNVTYFFTDDFDTISTGLSGTSDFPAELWATNVTAWNQTLDQTNPQSARLVGYVLTITGEGVTGSAANTMTLRSR